jgi:hypothetical protein
MARQSQGVIIRRESSVVGSTAAQEATNTISMEGTSKTIRRQAGFAAFSTGMIIECNASLNGNAYTIVTTAATAITVYEPLTDQASGASIQITGHAMQTVGQIVSFNGPSITANVIDVTNLGSSAKEKLVGVQDPGNLSISVMWENEASLAYLHDALIRDMQARTVRKYQIKFTDTGTSLPSAVYFSGMITGFNPSGAVDNALKADITMAISSGVKFMPAV